MKRRIDTIEVVSCAVVAAMCVIASLGFSGVFRSWTFLFPVLIAAIGCSAIALLVRSFHVLAGEAILCYTAGFFVLGLITTQWVPGLGSPAQFASDLAGGWTDLLSSQTPVDLRSSVATVPFTTTWIATVLAQEFDRKAGSIALPLAGVLVAFTATSLFSAETISVARIQGPALLSLALLLALVRRRQLEKASGLTVTRAGGGGRGPLGLLVPAGLLLIIGVLAAILGPQISNAADSDRFDLRDFQGNPWDPLAEASPLVTIKQQLKQEDDPEVMFTVRSNVEITRWTLARMASYSGVVWEVADPLLDRAAQFVPVDTEMPPSGEIGQGRSVRAEIEIGQLSGVWIPHAGAPVSVAFAERRDLRLNLGTATLAAPAGMRPGDTYTVVSQLPTVLADNAIEKAVIREEDESNDINLVPAPIRNLADRFVIGRDFGGAQVAAIRDLLTNEEIAFYDVTEAQPPGHSYGRIADFVFTPTRIVGYEEQYAATAGVLARIARIPTRVVVGYVIEPDRYSDGVAQVFATDASAWIEVRVDGAGWIPVDVTPDSSNMPTDLEQGVVTEPIAVPNEPPPPPPPLDQELPDDEEDEEEEDEDEDEGPVEADRTIMGFLLARPGLVAGTVAASPMIGIATLGALVALLKSARSRRRRSADEPRQRVIGAWEEVVDRFEEDGLYVPPNVTPLELAELVDDSRLPSAPDIDLRRLAALASGSAFAAHPPTDAETEEAWEEAERVNSAVKSDWTTSQRLRSGIDPRPLVRSAKRR